MGLNKFFIKVYCVILISSLLFGCSKDGDSSEESVINNEPEFGLKEIHDNGILKSSFSYNNENLIERRNSHDENGVIAAHTTFEYQQDSIIESRIIGDELWWQYEYYNISDSVVRMDEYDFINEGALPSHHLYYFMDSECGYNLKQSFFEGDDLTRETLVQYDIENCNYTATLYNDLGEVISMTQVVYDNMNGGYSITRNIKLSPHSNGNITAFSYWNDLGELNAEISFTSVFTYNSESYPVSEIKTYADGNIINVDYSYY